MNRIYILELAINLGLINILYMFCLSTKPLHVKITILTKNESHLTTFWLVESMSCNIHLCVSVCLSVCLIVSPCKVSAKNNEIILVINLITDYIIIYNLTLASYFIIFFYYYLLLFISDFYSAGLHICPPVNFEIYKFRCYWIPQFLIHIIKVRWRLCKCSDRADMQK